MKLSKKFKMLLLAIVVTVVGLTIVLILLSVVQKKDHGGDQEESPISYTTPPVSSSGNIIDINNGDGNVYEYATIAEDDTIRLFTSDGVGLIINLDRKNWRDLKVAPSGKHISVLGETVDGIFDLYVFDIKKESWLMATDFTSFGSGVTSYVWQDGDTVLLTQGLEGDNWLYSYKVSSITEIVKQKQVQGYIQSISFDGLKLIFYEPDSNLYSLYSSSGEFFYKLSDISVRKNVPPTVSYPATSSIIGSITPSSVIFTTNPEKLILNDGDFSFKHLFGSREAFRIDISRGFVPICAFTENLAFGYRLNSEDSVEFYNLDVKDETEEYVDQIKLNDNNDLDTNLWGCYENNRVIVDLEIGGKVKWFENLNEGKFQNLTFLDNVKEVFRL